MIFAGDANILFDIWMPSAKSQETIGRFRMNGGKIHTYKLFSTDQHGTMLNGEMDFATIGDEQWLVLLSGLLYFCMHPQWVVECDS